MPWLTSTLPVIVAGCVLLLQVPCGFECSQLQETMDDKPRDGSTLQKLTLVKNGDDRMKHVYRQSAIKTHHSGSKKRKTLRKQRVHPDGLETIYKKEVQQSQAAIPKRTRKRRSVGTGTAPKPTVPPALPTGKGSGGGAGNRIKYTINEPLLRSIIQQEVKNIIGSQTGGGGKSKGRQKRTKYPPVDKNHPVFKYWGTGYNPKMTAEMIEVRKEIGPKGAPKKKYRPPEWPPMIPLEDREKINRPPPGMGWEKVDYSPEDRIGIDLFGKGFSQHNIDLIAKEKWKVYDAYLERKKAQLAAAAPAEPTVPPEPEYFYDYGAASYIPYFDDEPSPPPSPHSSSLLTPKDKNEGYGHSFNPSPSKSSSSSGCTSLLCVADSKGSSSNSNYAYDYTE